MNALVTGATGFIGRKLLTHLDRPVVLTRDPERAAGLAGAPRPFGWDASCPVPAGALHGVDVVLHLAGDPIAEGRWTDAKKARIRDSRVLGTRHLVESLRHAQERPGVLVSASAVGVYGSRGDEPLDESSPPGSGFLPDVCIAWEREALAAEALGVRVVLVRIGVVLARDGGALARMLPVFRAGLGGPLGSGSQWMPWIHVDDVVGLLLHAATTAAVTGPMNACAPEAVTNRSFPRALARALGRPALLPVPSFALKAAFGELASVLLGSQRASPRVALGTGYRFRFPTLDGALGDLLGTGPRPKVVEAGP